MWLGKSLLAAAAQAFQNILILPNLFHCPKTSHIKAQSGLGDWIRGYASSRKDTMREREGKCIM